MSERRERPGWGRPGWRRAVLVALAGASFLAASVGGNAFCHSWPGEPTSALGAADLTEAVPGELLVKFREALPAASRQQVHQAALCTETVWLDGLNVAQVVVDAGSSLEEAARLYGYQAEVEWVEPNYILKTDLVPNDPFFVGRQQWYYDLIDAGKAWDVTTGAAGVVVAVLDTGIDTTHPDLQGAIWTNPAEVPDNGVDDDGNGCVDDVHGCNFATNTNPTCHYSAAFPNNDIEDDEGHGTFVAGIIAARGNNDVGVIGAAPGVTIMPVKVLDCSGAATTASAAAGALYAARAGARIINISFGGGEESGTLHDALRQAHDQYGALIIASAGNDAQASVEYPAAYDDVIAVSASDHHDPDEKAVFSNWGPDVDLTAPGVDIASTLPAQFCTGEAWDCFGGQPYAMAKGTSFSAPLVSGAAALILSLRPSLTPDAVEAQLKEAALPLPNGGFSNWAGAGRIQMDVGLQWTTYSVGLAGVTRN